MVVDTRNWLPGKKALVSPEWIEEVSWAEAKVHVNLPRIVSRMVPSMTRPFLATEGARSDCTIFMAVQSTGRDHRAVPAAVLLGKQNHKLVHIVADYGQGDLSFDGTRAADDAMVSLSAAPQPRFCSLYGAIEAVASESMLISDLISGSCATPFINSR